MKQCLILLLIWVWPFLCHAEAEFGLALKGGPDAATLAGENRVRRYGLTGGLGGYLQLPLARQFSLAGQLDLLYTPRGAKAVADGEYLGQARYHYLDIVAAVCPEVRVGLVGVYPKLGAGLSFLMSASKENASGVSEDITPFIKRTDVALVLGVGAALYLPRQALGALRLNTISLEIVHNRGLVDTDKINGGYENRVTSLMFGISLVLSSGATAALPP